MYKSETPSLVLINTFPVTSNLIPDTGPVFPIPRSPPAIKEQQEIIEDLKTRITKLEN
jgi:hypothetical protein